MKIILLTIGKTDDPRLRELCEDYIKRLTHYVPFEYVELHDLKKTRSLSTEQQKHAEGQLILAQLENADRVVLLDEKGKTFNSIGFSGYLQKQMNTGLKRLVFVIGGAYGFSDPVYHRADGKLALSEMTFSHQMVRLFALEQLYRAFTILRNEPYHHR